MNKMTKQEFKDGAEMLMMAYPSWNGKLNEKETAKFWYDRLSTRIEKGTFKNIINKYVENESRYPTIAGVLEVGKKYGYIRPLTNGQSNFL